MLAESHRSTMASAALADTCFGDHLDGSESVFSGLAVGMSQIDDPVRCAEAFVRLAHELRSED